MTTNIQKNELDVLRVSITNNRATMSHPLNTGFSTSLTGFLDYSFPVSFLYFGGKRYGYGDIKVIILG